ncbi:CoA-transferase [Aerococcaceae bacterium 50-4]
MNTKRKTLAEIVALIPDESSLAFTTSGIGGMAEEFFVGLRKHFDETNHPKYITVISAAGLARGEGTGSDLLLAPGLMKTYIGSHIHGAPLTGRAGLENKIALFIIPQGTIGLLFRNAAERGPGVWTKVGLNTHVDPRQGAGKMSDKAKLAADLMTVETVNGEEWLYYKPVAIDVTVIKATYADHNGNLAFDHEPMYLQALTMAMAAKNNGGIVIAQVEEVVTNGSLPAKSVLVPGIMVDYVYKATPAYHQQTFATDYSPLLSNEVRSEELPIKDHKLNNKAVIARRAALELKKGTIINIGVGLPSMISNLFYEANRLNEYHFTTDLGGVDGLPAPGYDYGPNYNAEAVIDTGDMFKFYHGGGLDATVLGFGEMDQQGNVNTTLLGHSIMGPGGMMDIIYGSSHVIFVGPFRVKDQTHIEKGKLMIDEPGVMSKFRKTLSHITFNGREAMKAGKRITIITDRAVFELNQEANLVLTEIAPGLDMQQDIIDQMDFDPIIADQVRTVDAHLFDEKWSLNDYLLTE